MSNEKTSVTGPDSPADPEVIKAPSELLGSGRLDERRFAGMGWLVVVVGFFGFVAWAAFAPLDQGVPVPGTVVVDGNRKSVQHPTGGIVDDILVREGDVVKPGQVLARMNNTQAKAQAEILRSQLATAQAIQARLLAERDGAAQPVFSPELLARTNEPAVAATVALQRQLLSSRRAALDSDLRATEEAIRGYESQQQGVINGRESRKLQQASLKEQLSNIRELAEQGYVARVRLLETERLYAQINASLSDDDATLGRVRSQILELRLRLNLRKDEYQKEVRTQLTEIQRDAETLASRLAAAEFEMAKTEVRAPAEGLIVGMAIFTKGGVIGPGFRMMDIVPQDQPLEVEGQVPVHLIDKVHAGLPVDMLFPALNQHKTPRVSGEVTGVSADRLVDEATRQPYFKLKAKVSPEGVRELAKQQIRPGMPVEVFVKTGERSLFNYLFKPIKDRAATALSEE